MRGAVPVMTYPPSEHEQPYARHAAELPHREPGGANPPPPEGPLWQPPAPLNANSASAFAPAVSHAVPPQPVTSRPAARQQWWPQSDPPEPGGPADVAGARPAPRDGRGGVSYGQAPATHGSAEVPTVSARSAWDDALPDLRNKAVNRLVSMNWNQTETTWKRRRRDPLNPHVLVFFFAEPPSGWPTRCELHVATRLFPAGDEPRLALLLYELTDVFRAHFKAKRDPETYIFSSRDRWSPHARYVGIGVTSLDTPAGSWDEVQKTAHSDLEVPGRCHAHLVDGSMLLIDRLSRRQFNETRIWASHTVRDVSGQRQRATTTAPDIATSDTYGPENRVVWQWLAALNGVMAEGLRHDH